MSVMHRMYSFWGYPLEWFYFIEYRIILSTVCIVYLVVISIGGLANFR